MTTREGSQELVQYRCQQCNAPYPLGADDVISTCPYCGYTFVVGGKQVGDHHLVPSTLDEESAKEITWKWLNKVAPKSVGKGILSDIEIETPRLQWIPLFRVDGVCEKYYFGANKEEVSENVHQFRKVEERETETTSVWILARRHAATFGVEEFIKSLEDSTTKDFDIGLTNAPVLNAEIDDEDAKTRAHHKKANLDREALSDELDELYDYRLTMNVNACGYIHTPYWLVRYNYKKGTFRVALSGATGEVILGELPITKTYRVKRWISSIILLVASSLVFQGLPYITFFALQSDSDEAFFAPVLVAAVGGIFWLASVLSIGAALRYEVCLTSEGEEREKTHGISGALSKLGVKIK